MITISNILVYIYKYTELENNWILHADTFPDD